MDKTDPRSFFGVNNLQFVASDYLYTGNFGLITPTAAEYTIAGVKAAGSASQPVGIVLGMFLRPSAVMDINLGVTSTNYVTVNYGANPHYAGSSPAPCQVFSGHNAAPANTVFRTYRSVPTTGIYISDLPVMIFNPYSFIAVGGTVNTGLDGWVTLYYGPGLIHPI